MLPPITSPTNPLVKELARLRDRAKRRETGRFLVEGATEIGRALDAAISAERLVYAGDTAAPLAARAAEAGIPCQPLGSPAFARISYRGDGEGAALVARSPGRALPADLPARQGPLLVLDGVEKPGNLGAMIRTAAASGAAGLIACDTGADFENPNTIRASRGLVFLLPGWTASPTEALAALRKGGYHLVGADAGEHPGYWQVPLPARTAFVLGREHDGLSPFWREAVDGLTRIPMRAGADSLNVSVSAALLLYEFERRREAGETA